LHTENLFEFCHVSETRIPVAPNAVHPKASPQEAVKVVEVAADTPCLDTEPSGKNA
jgi:hypothetical protein